MLRAKGLPRRDSPFLDQKSVDGENLLFPGDAPDEVPGPLKVLFAGTALGNSPNFPKYPKGIIARTLEAARPAYALFHQQLSHAPGVVTVGGAAGVRKKDPLVGRKVGVIHIRLQGVMERLVVYAGRQADDIVAGGVGGILLCEIDKVSAEQYVKNYEGIGISTLAIEADESGFCAGVMKGNTSLQEFINEKIAEYKESGKISEWYVEATEKASELGIE